VDRNLPDLCSTAEDEHDGSDEEEAEDDQLQEDMKQEETRERAVMLANLLVAAILVSALVLPLRLWMDGLWHPSSWSPLLSITINGCLLWLARLLHDHGRASAWLACLCFNAVLIYKVLFPPPNALPFHYVFCRI
jgi:predicted nucleic acid-binding Zn ribbon protein